MDKLSEIMAAKRREIEPIIRPVRDSELSNLGERMRSGPSFLDALSSPDELSVIAEIKENLLLPERSPLGHPRWNRHENTLMPMRTAYLF